MEKCCGWCAVTENWAGEGEGEAEEEKYCGHCGETGNTVEEGKVEGSGRRGRLNTVWEQTCGFPPPVPPHGYKKECGEGKENPPCSLDFEANSTRKVPRPVNEVG